MQMAALGGTVVRYLNCTLGTQRRVYYYERGGVRKGGREGGRNLN